MARDFDGVSDNIRPNENGVTGIDVTQFSIACLFNVQTGPSSGNVSLIFQNASAIAGGQSAAALHIHNDAGTLRFQLQYRWSTNFGEWDVTDTAVTTGQYFHGAVKYDRGATTNNPTLYLDGVAKTVGSGLTEISTPAGSAKTGVDSITMGENVGGSNDFDGFIAEVAFWDTLQDDEIFAAMGAGFSPRFFPANRQVYYPLMGRDSPEPELDQGANGTVTGATQTDHPRIIYPSRPHIITAPGPAPATTPTIFFVRTPFASSMR